MKVVTLDEFMNDRELQLQAARVLREEDGLVCFPCAGTYRLAASLLSVKGVLKLLQTKRRSKHRPALVMVASVAMADQVAAPIPLQARQVMGASWSQAVTVKLPLNKELPRKVYRELSKPDGKVGVRFPVGKLVQALVLEAGVPLLVSSANRSKKAGANSVALIRKQFAPAISLLVDAGDLPASNPSTIVEFDDAGAPLIVRQGGVSEDDIRAVIG